MQSLANASSSKGNDHSLIMLMFKLSSLLQTHVPRRADGFRIRPSRTTSGIILSFLFGECGMEVYKTWESSRVPLAGEEEDPVLFAKNRRRLKFNDMLEQTRQAYFDAHLIKFCYMQKVDEGPYVMFFEVFTATSNFGLSLSSIESFNRL